LKTTALRTSGDRRLFFDMMIIMKPLRLRNAMNVTMYTKMEREWPMNLLKIKAAPIAILKKTPATGRDCEEHSI